MGPRSERRGSADTLKHGGTVNRTRWLWEGGARDGAAAPRPVKDRSDGSCEAIETRTRTKSRAGVFASWAAEWPLRRVSRTNVPTAKAVKASIARSIGESAVTQGVVARMGAVSKPINAN